MSDIYRSVGARLNFRDFGSGIPVVFLHPTPLDGDYWRPLVAEIAAIRAVVPDLRGHGASELGAGLPVGGFARVPDAPVLTMSQLAQDVLALLDHLDMERPVFAGCSIGGYVLLELWRRAPQRMRGLIFICSKPQADTPEGLDKRAATIAQARSGATRTIFDGMAQTLVGATTRRLNPAVVAELRARMTISAEALVAVQAGLATRPDSLPTVSSITVPVLAVAGGEDTAIAVRDMEAFCAAPGGCVFEELPAAGHFAAYEQPRAVAALIEPWLRQMASIG